MKTTALKSMRTLIFQIGYSTYAQIGEGGGGGWSSFVLITRKLQKFKSLAVLSPRDFARKEYMEYDEIPY